MNANSYSQFVIRLRKRDEKWSFQSHVFDANNPVAMDRARETLHRAAGPKYSEGFTYVDTTIVQIVPPIP